MIWGNICQDKVVIQRPANIIHAGEVRPYHTEKCPRFTHMKHFSLRVMLPELEFSIKNLRDLPVLELIEVIFSQGCFSKQIIRKSPSCFKKCLKILVFLIDSGIDDCEIVVNYRDIGMPL